MAINKRMYVLPKNTEPTGEVISTLIGSVKRADELKRYNELDKYYNAERIVEEDDSEPLVAVTAFARYITGLNTGYLLGNPVTYTVSKESSANFEKIQDEYDDQIISNTDIRLANDASKFGHGFERIYVNEDSKCRSAVVDPRNIILVRDNTVEHKKMFAIIYVNSVNEKGEEVKDEYEVTILTPTMTMERHLKGTALTGDEGTDQLHFFNEVPVVEYMNDDDIIGDYEPVIPNIDAYNKLQTARVNDRMKNANSILLVSGGGLDDGAVEKIMNGRIADLPEGAEMKYITKSTNEEESEKLRDSIKDDIHMISMTPDVSDKNFAGSASGVSLQYKLFTFEKHAKDKERCFEAGLMERVHIYNIFLAKTANMPLIEIGDIDAVFKRALPQNDVETANMINALDGIVDRETLVSQLSFVVDAKETVELAAEEEDKKATDDAGNFGTDNPSEHELDDDENLEDM